MKPTFHSKKQSIKGKAGYSLVEVMIAVGLISIIATGVAMFYRTSTIILFTSDQKMKINSDIRTITNEMTDYARDANHFTLYESFNGDWRNPQDGETGADYRNRDGESGDFLLLIYYGEDPNPSDTTPPPIEKLVGYYRSTSFETSESGTEVADVESNVGPVMKFEFPSNAAEAAVLANNPSGPVETLIPDPSDSHKEVIQFSRGLANGKLFYNFRDRSIMVNGQIFHGNAAKRITDTYNFTISPRG